MVQEVNAGTTAMQSSLDAYAPRARPFSPPPGSAPLQRFSPVLVAPIAKPVWPAPSSCPSCVTLHGTLSDK